MKRLTCILYFSKLAESFPTGLLDEKENNQSSQDILTEEEEWSALAGRLDEQKDLFGPPPKQTER
jgi:hypothetical protein